VLRPQPVPVRPLLIIYSITWALESIGLIVFFGLPGPGLVGLSVMGIFVVLAWSRVIRRRYASPLEFNPERNG
jgi:hypothetical protein